MKSFGFDRNTGIDLGGESHWPLKLPGDGLWYEVDLATNYVRPGHIGNPYPNGNCNWRDRK
jgi:hypothetical protein